MTIELITQQDYDRLLAIQKEYPNLTYQNKGYEYPNRIAWVEEEHNAFREVEDILNKSIKGFSALNHFRLSKKDGEIQLRFQYNWGAEDNSMPFIGVGYILVDELLNGFKNNEDEKVK